MYTELHRYWIPCSIRPDFSQFQVLMNKFCYRLQVGQIRELSSYAFVSCSILFFHLLIFFIICRKIPAVSVIRIRNGSCTNATIWNVWNLWSNFTKLDLRGSRSYIHPFWIYDKLTIAIPSLSPIICFGNQSKVVKGLYKILLMFLYCIILVTTEYHNKFEFLQLTHN